MKKLLFTLSAILLFGCVGFGQTVKTDSQTTILSLEERKILGEILATQTGMGLCANLPDNEDCKKDDYQQRFKEAITKAVNYPNVIFMLLTNVAKTYEENKINARSAPQISQVADEQNAQLFRIIVVQNQRIIELLEQLVKKK